MTTIQLINHPDSGISAQNFATIEAALKLFAPMVTTAWNLPPVTITTDPVAGAWVMHITNQNQQVGAAGYHNVANGIPTAYCSPNASYRVFGNYYPAFSIRGKVLTPERFSPGLVTTIAHEMAEMLCDPTINTVSAVDSNGHQWLVEVCDHVFGSYFPITVFNTACVMPDVTTPNFYKLGSKAPYSLHNAVSAPFTLTPQGYAYYKGANGQLIKV